MAKNFLADQVFDVKLIAASAYETYTGCEILKLDEHTLVFKHKPKRLKRLATMIIARKDVHIVMGETGDTDCTITIMKHHVVSKHYPRCSVAFSSNSGEVKITPDDKKYKPFTAQLSSLEISGVVMDDVAPKKSKKEKEEKKKKVA